MLILHSKCVKDTMAARRTGKPVGRPSDPRKLEAILDAGWVLFLERGVEGVSLEMVAERAGVAKATLYKHFQDKAALFEAGVLREMQRIEAAQRLGPGTIPDESLEEVLRTFGLGILTFLLSDPAVAFYNAVAGELSRHPGLARRFYESGPGRTRQNLIGILAAAAKKGEIAVEDPAQAAEHLFGLWQGFSNFQLSLGVQREQIRAELPARVESAIQVFLKAYAAS